MYSARPGLQFDPMRTGPDDGIFSISMAYRCLAMYAMSDALPNAPGRKRWYGHRERPPGPKAETGWSTDYPAISLDHDGAPGAPRGSPGRPGSLERAMLLRSAPDLSKLGLRGTLRGSPGTAGFFSFCHLFSFLASFSVFFVYRCMLFPCFCAASRTLPEAPAGPPPQGRPGAPRGARKAWNGPCCLDRRPI